MGLLDTVKGWLNIGGVKVVIWKYTEPLTRGQVLPTMKGAVLLKTKSPKTVLGLEIKLVEEFTSGQNEDRTTETTVLGWGVPAGDNKLTYPVDLKPGEDKEELFELTYILSNRLQNYGGVLGAVGKLAAFAKTEKTEYYLIASAKVKGAAFETAHKILMKVGP